MQMRITELLVAYLCSTRQQLASRLTGRGFEIKVELCKMGGSCSAPKAQELLSM